MTKRFFNTLIMIASLAAITNLQAGEKVDRTLDVATTGSIEIHNSRGKVSVTGWDNQTIKVKGALDDLTENFIFKTNNDKTLLKVVLPDRDLSTRSGKGSNLTIHVPKQYSIQFNGVATDIQVTGIENHVDINSVSGKITLQSVLGKADINSVSGNIDLNKVDGDIDCSTISGDVSANVNSKEISVNGVSSDITISTPSISLARVATVSGDTKLRGTLDVEGSIKLSNVSGESIYYASKDISADVDLNTGPGGNIVNSISSDKPSSSFIGSEKLRTSLGDGKGIIQMTTVSGSIGLKSDN